MRTKQITKSVQLRNCYFHEKGEAEECLMCRGTDSVLVCKCGCARPTWQGLAFFKSTECTRHHLDVPMPQNIAEWIEEGLRQAAG